MEQKMLLALVGHSRQIISRDVQIALNFTYTLMALLPVKISIETLLNILIISFLGND